MRLMSHPAFDKYYLAGGTSLALQLGHRMSVDIDLFTDELYPSIDLSVIKRGLQDLFPHIRNIETLESHSMVQTLFVGDDEGSEIKLDLCYDEPRFDNLVLTDGLRLASIKEIGAMKMNAIVNGERRKDYWDVHELMTQHTLEEIIDWSLEKYPFSLSREDILNRIASVWDLPDKTEIISLREGIWEFVADDLCDESVKLLKKGL